MSCSGSDSLLLVHSEWLVPGIVGYACLLVSNNSRYEKELIKPQDTTDVESLAITYG